MLRPGRGGLTTRDFRDRVHRTIPINLWWGSKGGGSQSGLMSGLPFCACCRYLGWWECTTLPVFEDDLRLDSGGSTAVGFAVRVRVQ